MTGVQTCALPIWAQDFDAGAKAVSLTGEGFAGMTWLQLVGVAASFLFGETLIPPYAHRALAARSDAASSRGFILAGAYSLVWLFICATLGIYAHGYIDPATPADDVFLSMGRILLPYGSFGLLLAGVIAIVMSSQESVLNAGTVCLVRDIIGSGFALSDRASLLLSRVGTLLIAIIAALAARYSPSIIDGLLVCYSLWAPALLLPLLLGLYLKRTAPLAGVLSILCGAGTSIAWQMFLHEPAGIPAILVGLLASALAYGLGHLLTAGDNLREVYQ